MERQKNQQSLKSSWSNINPHLALLKRKNVTESDRDEEKKIADEQKQKELEEKQLRKQERRRQIASKK